MSAPRLEERFIHLGLGARAEVLPPFTGMEWYADYGARAAADGVEGRLVSQYSFTEDWTSWEMHPAGAEVVICTAGAMVLVQEWPDGRRESVALAAGEYAINPPGVWHTADVAGAATAIFITAGEGTQHRAR
jgi:mannose-6-phosphate isomerase-like protein (cupin superfamily)